MDTKKINEIAAHNLLTEISMISARRIQSFVHEAIRAAPPYYWIRPSGNHPGRHPDDEHGSWGNLIHVKRVIVIATLFIEAEDLDPMYRDIIYSGLIIHDLGKYDVNGLSDTTVGGHPLLVQEVLKNVEPCPLMGLILRVAETHMGRWGEKRPDAMFEKLASYADYIASRANIHIPIELKI